MSRRRGAQDYQAVLDELAANAARQLSLRAVSRQRPMPHAAYDAAISNWFANELKTEAPDYALLAEG